MEKPAIISEDAVIDWCEKRRGGPYVVIGSRDQREAQRDDTYQKMLDAYEPLIERLIEQTRKLLKPIKEAKAEVAREIDSALEDIPKKYRTDYTVEIDKNDWLKVRDYIRSLANPVKSKYTEGK